ncbi:hypothetical protein [Conyzicola nivalis]|uniref:hypothetical protein n=1 Tax=Conyzicola nivalis TaxID=1477021 RepID=UPI001668DD63|nr:hypothetical protein [Conyzicola nivalis]
MLAAIAALTITASTLTASPAHAVGVGAGSANAGSANAGSANAGSANAGSANAGSTNAGSVDAAGVEQILRGAGAVADVAPPSRSKLAAPDASSTAQAPAVTSGARVSLKTGLTVPTGTNSLSITPVTDAGSAKALSPSGLAVYANTADSAFALSAASTGGNAGYVVINAPTAPTAYRFAFTVDGKPAVLRPVEGGGIDVLSASGAVVNSVVPAWAKDATGAAVPTSYSVAGNILTQNVSHAGAAYPVIADPRVRCDRLWCTLELTRGETAALAANVLPVGGACAILGGGAPVCAAVLAGAWAQASLALGSGQCIGFRVWKANFVSYAHLAYIRCYA